YAARYSQLPTTSSSPDLFEYTGISDTPTDLAAGKVVSVEFIPEDETKAFVVFTFGDTTDGVPADIANQTVVLMATMASATSAVTWDTVPSTSSEAQKSSINTKYLPRLK